MKNLNAYNQDNYLIHKESVERKEKSESKNRLLSISKEIKDSYEVFNNNYNSEKFYNNSPNDKLTDFKDDLIKLYKYKNKVGNLIREKIFNIQEQTIQYTCQFCTLNTVNTLDHLLPKSKFPEFVVNIKNLIPCCSECNNYKNNSFSNNTNEKILNLYLDKLPNCQYLFVDIKWNERKVKFFLENRFSIQSDLFIIITNHYTKLKLVERFILKSNEILSEFINHCKNFTPNYNKEKFIETQKTLINDNQNAYGKNHWKHVLQLALLENEEFMNQFYNY